MTSSFTAKTKKVSFLEIAKMYKGTENEENFQNVCNILKDQKIEYRFLKVEEAPVGWRILLKGEKYNLFEADIENEEIKKLEYYGKKYILVLCDGENAITVSEDSFIFPWEKED